MRITGAKMKAMSPLKMVRLNMTANATPQMATMMADTIW